MISKCVFDSGTHTLKDQVPLSSKIMKNKSKNGSQRSEEIKSFLKKCQFVIVFLIASPCGKVRSNCLRKDSPASGQNGWF